MENLSPARDPRSILRAMSIEEAARFRPISAAEIDGALEEGQKDRSSAERSATQPSVNSSMLFR